MRVSALFCFGIGLGDKSNYLLKDKSLVCYFCSFNMNDGIVGVFSTYHIFQQKQLMRGQRHPAKSPRILDYIPEDTIQADKYYACLCLCRCITFSL